MGTFLAVEEYTLFNEVSSITLDFEKDVKGTIHSV